MIRCFRRNGIVRTKTAHPNEPYLRKQWIREGLPSRASGHAKAGHRGAEAACHRNFGSPSAFASRFINGNIVFSAQKAQPRPSRCSSLIRAEETSAFFAQVPNSGRNKACALRHVQIRRAEKRENSRLAEEKRLCERRASSPVRRPAEKPEEAKRKNSGHGTVHQSLHPGDTAYIMSFLHTDSDSAE